MRRRLVPSAGRRRGGEDWQFPSLVIEGRPIDIAVAVALDVISSRRCRYKCIGLTARATWFTVTGAGGSHHVEAVMRLLRAGAAAALVLTLWDQF